MYPKQFVSVTETDNVCKSKAAGDETDASNSDSTSTESVESESESSQDSYPLSASETTLLYLSNDTSVERRPTLAFPERENSETPALPSDCYFEDGESLIDLVICFSPGGKNERRDGIYRLKFMTLLESLGLQTEVSESANGTTGFIKIHAPYNFLSKTAEKTGMRMPIEVFKNERSPSLSSRLIAKCCLRKQKQCLKIPNDKKRPSAGYYRMPFSRNIEHQFLGQENRETFFTIIQRIQLIDHVIQRLSLPVIEKRWKGEDIEAGYTSRAKIGFYWLVENNVLSHEMPLHDCDENDLASQQLPVVRQPLRRYLIDIWANFNLSSIFCYQPLDQIRNYFGPKLALYFAWLGFYTTWLTIPACCGGFD